MHPRLKQAAEHRLVFLCAALALVIAGVFVFSARAPHTPQPAGPGVRASSQPIKNPSAPSVGRDGGGGTDSRQESRTRVERLASLLREFKEAADEDTINRIEDDISTLLEYASTGEVLRLLPSDVVDTALGRAEFRSFLLQSPKDSFNWLGQLPEVSDAHLRCVLQAWAVSDHDGLAEVLAALPEGSWRESALGATVNLLQDTRPEVATQLALTMAPGPRRSGLLAQIAATWGESDAERAMKWAHTLNDATTRQQVNAALAVVIPGKHPELAAACLGRLDANSELHAQAIAEIAARIAEADPARMARWATIADLGEATPFLVRATTAAWAHRDRRAADAWAASLPEGLHRDAASEVLATLSPDGQL